jgi:phosphoglycerate dehydrogenase-like enzyme
MATILITTACSRPGDEADALLTAAGHETRYGAGDVENLAGIEGAIVAHDDLSAEVLAKASALRAVVRSGVGYDSVDVEAATRLGISVSNLPGVNSNAVAEYAMGLLLAAARHLVPAAIGVRDGEWPRWSGHELRGATLGIVGYGASARALVPLARAFGMAILCSTSVSQFHDPAVRFVELGELLREADYVSLHTALTPRTRHLIDADALAAMKPTAFLVNTARGAIVDEAALVRAVGSGVIAGAHLDVVDVEPLPITSPLRNVDGITVYSHLAGQTAQARRATALAAARELLAALAGRPRTPVNHLGEK